MSDSKIRRKAKSYTVTLATAVAAVDAVPMVDMAGGVVSVGTMSTNASALNLYVSDEEDGTYRQLHDSVGSAANIALQPSTAVGKAYALPDAAFGAQWIKLVSSTTNSTGVTAIVTMKG
jgi:uncharacterized protein YigE (DUF2233 family)